MKITLREYQKEDFKALEKIIKETWHYDDFSSPKTAQKLARAFLSSCLTNQTFSCVAIHNDVPIGIILVNIKAKHKCPLGLRIQQIKAILALLISKEGRKVSKIFENVDQIDRKLLKECNTDYPAELALFAVDSSYRSKGVGKQLFQEALSYMSSQKLDKFYLFTDTSCNYGFYEHQGMIKRNEKEHSFNLNDHIIKMNFFIYDYTNHH